MKKIITIVTALTMALPMLASAATFTFSPRSGTYTPGQTFSVGVYVNPANGEKITTAKLSMLVLPQNIAFVSFTPATGWMPLVQPGYDSVDTTTGNILKTAGFPSKVSSSTKFGDFVFRAKAEGTGPISVLNDSMLLNATNVNKYTSSQGATFTIKAPVVALATPKPTPPVEKTPVVPSTTKEPVTTTNATSATESVAVGTSTNTIDETQPNNQLAAAATSGFSWTYKVILYIILAGLIILITGFLSWKRFKKGKNRF